MGTHPRTRWLRFRERNTARGHNAASPSQPTDQQPGNPSAIRLVMFSEVDSWTYQHSSATMNYIQARQWCRAHYTDMVAIQNGEENEHLNEILPFTPTYYWIGIRKIRNQWTWVGTSKALTEEAKNWEDNEPNNKKNNEDCVEIYIKRRRDPTSCHAASCSGNGECVETINNHTCQCYEGFYGSECQHMMPCEPLEAPRPGFLNCSHPVQEFSYNSSCQISCVEGYALNSLDSVQCTSSGRWTATMSECQVMKCNGLEDPAQGVMNCSHPLGDFMSNSTCNFACDKGFVMTGSDRLQCGASGEWDGNQPECEAVQCDQVTMVEHSTVTCSGSYGKYSYNATCDFTCDEGYAMSGSAGLRCTAEGEWTDEVPKCEALQELGIIGGGPWMKGSSLDQYHWTKTPWMEEGGRHKQLVIVKETPHEEDES